MKIQKVNGYLVFAPLNNADGRKIEMTISRFIKETHVDIKQGKPELSLIARLTPGVVFNTLPFLTTNKQKVEVCANLLDYLALRLENYVDQIARNEIPASAFVIASYCLNYIWGTFKPTKRLLPAKTYASANRFCRSLIKVTGEAHGVARSGQTICDLIMTNPSFHPLEKTTNGPWYDSLSGTAKESAIRDSIYTIICGDPLNWVKELSHFMIWLSGATVLKDIHSSRKHKKTGN